MRLRSAVGPAAVIGVCLIVIISLATASPTGRLDAYLRAAAGADADRGWRFLDTWTQAEFDGDRARYVAEASAADWSAFHWSNPRVGFVDDGVAHVSVELDSDPSTVPTFLFERRIVHGICSDPGGGHAVGAYVLVGMFSGSGLGGGARAGSTLRCNAEFIGP